MHRKVTIRAEEKYVLPLMEKKERNLAGKL